MLCIAFVNGIVFLISHSASSLLDIEMQPIFEIDLVPSTLLYLFIISNSFFVKYLKFSIYKIISHANSDSFTSWLSYGLIETVVFEKLVHFF